MVRFHTPISLRSSRTDFCSTTPLAFVTCLLRMLIWGPTGVVLRSTTLLTAVCRRLKADLHGTIFVSCDELTTGLGHDLRLVCTSEKCRIKYYGILLEPALQRWEVLILCSRGPHNCKTGHFTSRKERERLRKVQKWKMHVQSVQNYSLCMQICDVLVAVVVVVA